MYEIAIRVFVILLIWAALWFVSGYIFIRWFVAALNWLRTAAIGFYTNVIWSWSKAKIWFYGTQDQVKLYNSVVGGIQNGLRLNMFCLGSGAIMVNAAPYLIIVVENEDVGRKLMFWHRRKIYRLAMRRLWELQVKSLA